VDDVFGLTIYQALVMDGAFCPEDGKRKFTNEEFRAIRARQGL
jgi:hypothetical protein